MLDRKSVYIMKKCVEEKEVSLSQLIQMMELSKRQVLYAIEKANEFLIDASVAPLHLEGRFLSLSTETKDYIVQCFLNQTIYHSYLLDGPERETYIFLMLLYRYESYVSVPHFLDTLEVGKTTFLQDMKHLEETLANENITVLNNRTIGYYLAGDEWQIRALLMRNILIDFNQPTGSFLYDYFLFHENIADFDGLQKHVADLLKKYHIQLVENRLREFCYTFQLLLPRLGIANQISNKTYHLEFFHQMKEYDLATELLATYQIENEEAKKYICSWILSLSVGNVHEQTFDRSIILEIVTRMTNRFELLSGIRFTDEEKVIEKLYGHFRSVYYRLFFRIPIINYFTERIQETYPDMIKIVEEVLKPISALFEDPIPEEEIAFLTMHFVAAIHQFEEKKSAGKNVGIVVCPSGIGSSAIVLNELKSLFPEFVFLGPFDTDILETIHEEYDYIFSTEPNVRLYTANKPVFIVNPILTPAERYHLLRSVYATTQTAMLSFPKISDLMSVIEKYATIKNRNHLEKELSELLINEPVQKDVVYEKDELNLSDVLKKEFIQFHLPATTYTQAVQQSAAPLLTDGIVTENYLAEIIHSAGERKSWMMITDGVALPHTKPIYGANAIGLSLGVLETPILLENGREMRYIMVLSAIDNHQHLKAIAQLVHFLEDGTFFELLQTTDSPEKIFAYIVEHEKGVGEQA